MVNEAFEKIRPYHAEEIPDAIRRIILDKSFFPVVEWLFPNLTQDVIKKQLLSISGVDEFQEKFMYPAVHSILAKTSNGLTSGGFDNISADKEYLFFANHRDIALDSTILQLLLYEHKFRTTEISAGSNLLISPLLTEIGKINKMFTVFREGEGKEFYQNYLNLSDYIRYVITEKKSSVWIAQRNGRTKNGDDKTEVALLKMLHASNPGNLLSGFEELNLVPVIISYEYEPCDALKVREIYESMKGEYQKRPGEDRESILAGITQPKGRIHLQIGHPVNSDLPALQTVKKPSEKFQVLAHLIDRQIHSNYKLFPTNMIAYDLLSGKKKFKEHYSPEEKVHFQEYVDEKIALLHGDHNVLKEMLLSIYAKTVENNMSNIRTGRTNNL